MFQVIMAKNRKKIFSNFDEIFKKKKEKRKKKKKKEPSNQHITWMFSTSVKRRSALCYFSFFLLYLFLSKTRFSKIIYCGWFNQHSCRTSIRVVLVSPWNKNGEQNGNHVLKQQEFWLILRRVCYFLFFLPYNGPPLPRLHFLYTFPRGSFPRTSKVTVWEIARHCQGFRSRYVVQLVYNFHATILGTTFDKPTPRNTTSLPVHLMNCANYYYTGYNQHCLAKPIPHHTHPPTHTHTPTPSPLPTYWSAR